MAETNNKPEKKEGKILPIRVTLEQYDDIHTIKANSGNVRMNNQEWYNKIFEKGIESLKI